MKVRARTLWKVPVYCLLASWVSYYITVYIGGFFFTVQSVGADGVTQISVDPVRSGIFSAVLFMAVLLVCGLWAFRKMTKPEVAISAAIASAIYLILALAQLLIPGFPLAMSMMLAYIQTWTRTVSAGLLKLTDHFALSVILASFTPLLFIPFGRKMNT